MTQSPPDPDERALTSACVKGDPEAWALFVGHYRPHVLRVARAYLVRAGADDPQVLAEDAAADVFAHLLAHDRQALSRFEWRSSLRTWLGVLTRRRAGRLLEQAQRTGQLGEPGRVRALITSPSEEASSLERQNLLRTRLQELPTRDRLALQLFYEAGRTYKEVARILDLPEAHVSSLLARARKRLARALEE